MSPMIRKQVYIEPRHEQRLKMLAKELDVTEAALIRRSIDRGLEGLGEPRPDPEAWKAAERRILARMRRGHLKGKRMWTRENLHDR